MRSRRCIVPAAFGRWLAAGIFMAACVACAAPSSQRLTPSNEPAQRLVPSARSIRHLYVIRFDAVKAVLEYAIYDGIPNESADRVISGLYGPTALTVDAAGHVYVLDGRIVKEFSAGASGRARPIREIDVPSQKNIDTLAVDTRGYLYLGQAGRVNVYAPNAQGRARPIARIKPIGYPAGLTVDSGNHLYALGNTQKNDPYLTFRTHVSVYSPAPKPRRIREFCSHELTAHGIDYGVAVDERHRLFTAHTYFINSYPHGLIDVYAENADTCPVNPLQKITTSSPSLHEPVYLTVDAPYLYVCDVDYGNGGAVFTLRTNRTEQVPLSTLYIAHKRPHTVMGIAVGP